MKALDAIILKAAEDEDFRQILREFPEVYASLSEEDQTRLREALQENDTVNAAPRGVESRTTKYGGTETEVTDQGSWPNTPFTS